MPTPVAGIETFGKTLDEIFSHLHTPRYAKVPFVFYMHSADSATYVLEHNFIYKKKRLYYFTPENIEAPMRSVETCYHALAAAFAGLVNESDNPNRDALTNFVFAVMRCPGDPVGQYRYSFFNALQKPPFATYEDWCNDVVGRLLRSYRLDERENRYRSSVTIAKSNATTIPRKKAKATGTPMFNAVYSQLDASQQQILDRLTVGTKVLCLRPGKRFGSTMTVKSVTPGHNSHIDVFLTTGIINSDKVSFYAKDGTPSVQPVTFDRAADGVSTEDVLVADEKGVLGFKCGRSRYALVA
jgi:hypothetical protein